MIRKVTFAVVLLFCLATAGHADAVNPVFQIAGKLHMLDWAHVDPTSAEKLLSPARVARERVDYPADYHGKKQCAPPLFMRADVAGLNLTLEFEPYGDACQLKLHTVSVRAELSANAAELMWGEFVRRLRPGGEPRTTGASNARYVWRSNDSRTRYDLFLAIGTDSTVTPDTATRFRLVLTHDVVEPEMVDDLPFAKGVMLICK